MYHKILLKSLNYLLIIVSPPFLLFMWNSIESIKIFYKVLFTYLNDLMHAVSKNRKEVLLKYFLNVLWAVTIWIAKQKGFCSQIVLKIQDTNLKIQISKKYFRKLNILDVCKSTDLYTFWRSKINWLCFENSIH